MDYLTQNQRVKVGINNVWIEAEGKEANFLILCFGILLLCIAFATVISSVQ